MEVVEQSDETWSGQAVVSRVRAGQGRAGQVRSSRGHGLGAGDQRTHRLDDGIKPGPFAHPASGKLRLGEPLVLHLRAWAGLRSLGIKPPATVQTQMRDRTSHLHRTNYLPPRPSTHCTSTMNITEIKGEGALLGRRYYQTLWTFQHLSLLLLLLRL